MASQESKGWTKETELLFSLSLLAFLQFWRIWILPSRSDSQHMLSRGVGGGSGEDGMGMHSRSVAVETSLCPSNCPSMDNSLWSYQTIFLGWITYLRTSVLIPNLVCCVPVTSLPGGRTQDLLKPVELTCSSIPRCQNRGSLLEHEEARLKAEGSSHKHRQQGRQDTCMQYQHA